MLRGGGGASARRGKCIFSLAYSFTFFFTMCKIVSNKPNFLIKQEELIKSNRSKELHVIHCCFHSRGVGEGRPESGKGRRAARRLESTSAWKVRTSLKERWRTVSALCSRWVTDVPGRRGGCWESVFRSLPSRGAGSRNWPSLVMEVQGAHTSKWTLSEAAGHKVA